MKVKLDLEIAIFHLWTLGPPSPPSFRTLYDGSAPIIFPSGPVTLQSLLAGALGGVRTSMAESLRSLSVRGHSLPLLSPPLILLAATNLKTFTMKGWYWY